MFEMLCGAVKVQTR
jgi:hypothetical protein